MQEGWYCRSLASEQASSQQDEPTDPNADDDSGSDDSQEQEEEASPAGREGSAPVDYKTQYRYMKHKLKFLIYENEFFQDALRSNQRRLLKVSRDRAFLLDRLLQYEKAENSSSESERTESSEDEAVKEAKKRKLDSGTNNGTPGSQRGRKKKTPATTEVVGAPTELSVASAGISEQIIATAPVIAPLEPEPQQGHMTAAEIERHLQSRQPVMMDLMTERAPATVPAEMFSNEPSLDSEPTEHLMDGSSPTHVAAEECVPMEYSN